MKRVLLVAYHYPPDTAVGAVRPSKFACYLPDFGWEPTVLTVPMSDASPSVNRKEIAEIHRVAEWPHPLKSYERLMMQLVRQRGQEDELLAKITVPHSLAMAPTLGGFRGLKRWLLAFLWLPDREIGWLVPAIWRGRHLIRKKRITHIVTTAPPFSCHLVGAALKRLTGVTWVADFRDPWSLNHKLQVLRNRATDFVEARLIRSVMTGADLVVSVTPQMTEEARKEHAYLDPDKFVTLTNGFDASDFISLTAVPRPHPVVFAYLGTFYYGRTPEPFLRALKSLIDDGTVKATDIRVKFVGHVAAADHQSTPEMVQRFGLEGIVSVNPSIPRREALRQTMEAHVLLVLTEQQPHAYTFKLFEALASGASILNIGSGGAVADLLAKTWRGISVAHTDIAEIRAGILECIRRSRGMENRRNPEPWLDPTIQDFNFQRLTGRLAELLDRLGANELKPERV